MRPLSTRKRPNRRPDAVIAGVVQAAPVFFIFPLHGLSSPAYRRQPSSPRKISAFCLYFSNCAKLTVSELSSIPENNSLHAYFMSIRKTTLPFLLMLCIGMLPLQNLNAGNADHMQAMLNDCANCDSGDGVAHGSCDDARCLLSAGFCGTQGVTSIFSRSLWTTMPQQFLAGWQSYKSRYRSRLDFSIYRPPIA